MPNSSTFLGVFPGNIEFKVFSRKKSNSRTFKDLYEPWEHMTQAWTIQQEKSELLQSCDL